ncbi:MAG: CHASE3 domain-containing protein [Ottowia sp.]|uniref:sensor histidine kinase n=1 Tax=Ottowia sp. TaxID=1898956 RepID=UPI003C73AF86
MHSQISDSSIRRRSLSALRLALIIAALCALAMVLVNESTHMRATQVLQEVEQANQMRTTISSLTRALTEAESNQRGYTLTGDRRYLEPYDNALNEIVRLRKTLETPQATSMFNLSTLLSFRSFMSEKMSEMALTVRMREDNRPEVVDFVVTSNVGLEQMAAFRAQSDELLSQADTYIQERRQELQRLLNVSRLGLVAGVLAAFVAFFLHLKQTRAMQRASEAHQNALEAERDALESQVRERTTRLAELATHLQQAVEDERAHLARELHDELGALLTAAKLDVARLKSRLPPDATDLAERLKHLTETLNQGIALKRRIIEDLRPSSLSNLGLVASLEILCREFADRSGLHVQTALEPVELDSAAELTIYRMVQEALTNIGKYAEAKNIRVVLKNYVYHAEVSITDDGRGFDPSALPQSSHGLVGMRHRVEAGGGRLDINSGAGRGTRITGTVPRGQARAQSQLATASGAMSVNSYARETTSPTPDTAHG